MTKRKKESKIIPFFCHILKKSLEEIFLKKCSIMEREKMVADLRIKTNLILD